MNTINTTNTTNTTNIINIKFIDKQANINNLSTNLLDYLYKENPVTNLSEEIRTYINNKIGKTLHKEIELELKEFFKNEDKIDIEGFINFRLPKYAHEINLILYATVKKHFTNHFNILT